MLYQNSRNRRVAGEEELVVGSAYLGLGGFSLIGHSSNDVV
jgi:hypothetical protein